MVYPALYSTLQGRCRPSRREKKKKENPAQSRGYKPELPGSTEGGGGVCCTLGRDKSATVEKGASVISLMHSIQKRFMVVALESKWA